MAIVLHDLGTATDTAGATVTITNVTIPDGSFIFVAAYEKNALGHGFFNDTSGNFYGFIDSEAPAGLSANGTLLSNYVYASTALVNGTITYSKLTSGSFASVVAFWATGIATSFDPRDTSTGTSSIGNNPSISTLVPTFENGDLVVGVTAWVASAGDTFTQDSVNGTYSTPPDQIINTANASGLAGGSFVAAANGIQTYSPTLNNSRDWAIIIQCFRKAPPPPPEPKRVSVFDLGTSGGSAGATQTLTGLNVPAGSLIYVNVYEKATGSIFAASISDSAGNVWQLNDREEPGGHANGTAYMYYVLNCKALVGGTITYTKTISGNFVGMGALYATNVSTDPNAYYDANSFNDNGGTSATPSVQSGGGFRFAGKGELVLASLFWVAGAGDTVTQDNTSGPWAFAPSTFVNSGAACGISGGFMIAPDIHSITYSPTLNNSRAWSMALQAFVAADDVAHDSVELMGIGNY